MSEVLSFMIVERSLNVHLGLVRVFINSLLLFNLFSIMLLLFIYCFFVSLVLDRTRKPSWRWQTRATQNDARIPPFRSYNKFQSSRKSGVYSN